MNTSNFDAIIVGSGAGGCAAAYKLVSSGLRVLLLEKGAPLPKDASTLDFDKVVHRGVFKSMERWLDHSGKPIAPEEHFNVGGKTKWYGAALLRFARHEFEADSAHGCLAWPFGYDEFAPYYDEAEGLLDVRTFPVEPNLAHIVAKLQRTSPMWRTEPLQLGLSKDILDHQVEAMRFDGFASIDDTKADGETAFLSRIRDQSNFHLLSNAEVVELLANPYDARHIIGVRLRDGREFTADHVILAAGALHSPRLLQRYLQSSGLKNELPSARLVGRNLKLHLLTAVVAVSTARMDDILRKTTVILNDAMPHSSVQPLGFDGQLISTLMPRLVPGVIAQQIGARAYGFFLQTEDGSHPDNRVVEDASGPHLNYLGERSIAAETEHRQLVRQFRNALAKMGYAAFSKRIGIEGTAHACGTMVTGSVPGLSVVDAEGQVHGMRSLYVADGSILPRSSRVNPSLSIYAWSLRVAERIAAKTRVTQEAEALETQP
jgi:choline dehydrogenase-like flavoprotein